MVNEFKSIEEKEWNNIILNLNNPNFFQSYSISKTYNNIKYLYSIKNKKINIASLLRFDNNHITIPFGPIHNDETNMEEIVEYVKEIGNIYNQDVVFTVTDEEKKELENNNNIKDYWIFKTPLIDTNCSIEEVESRFNTNRRRIIKKVLEKYGTDSLDTSIEFAEEFYNLYCKRFKETGGIIDINMEMLEKLLLNDDVKLVVCKDNNKVIAGAIIFDFFDTKITRYNAFDSEYSKSSPIARIDYEMLKESCEDDKILYYDMSGLAFGDLITEKNKGINRYKESYGPKYIKTYNWVKYERNV